MELQLPALLNANEAYRRGKIRPTRSARPARHLVILTCMDTRLDLFGPLGLEVGDAHILRNAGGRATTDAVRSLVVSAHFLGTREVGVIHHTDCGLKGVTDDELALRTGVSSLEFFAFNDLEESVREDIDLVRSCDLLPQGLIAWGAIYDVDTSVLRLVNEG